MTGSRRGASGCGSGTPPGGARVGPQRRPVAVTAPTAYGRTRVAGRCHSRRTCVLECLPAPGVRAVVLPPFAELHCHSHFSFLDGASAPDDLVARAVELGLSALAVTDHQGLYGAVRF